MAGVVLSKVTAKTAAEICQHVELAPPARQELRDGLSPAQFVDALLARQHFREAARFLAQALPKREAVWWACLCARQVAANPPAKAAAALQAAEKWVADPSDAHRRAALPAADAAGYGTPAGCAALAAFLSGGSLGPPEVADIPPAEQLTGQMVAGAIALAAVATEPHKEPEKLRAFLTKGIEVGNGAQRWKSA